MKGVILAGGSGTRLKPLSTAINKHVFPVNNLPMIYYPINTLVSGGITEILVVLGGHSIGKIIRLIEEEGKFNAKFTYKYQADAFGIAHALNLARDFVDGNFALILGDNIFIDKIDFSVSDVPHLFLSETNNPEKFGVAVIEEEKIVRMVEKPKDFISNLAITGLYVYPESVFDVIDELEPSKRGELEITDLNNRYFCAYTLLHKPWFDVGEYDSLMQASNYLVECDFWRSIDYDTGS